MFDPTLADRENKGEKFEHSKNVKTGVSKFINSKNAGEISLNTYHEGTKNQLFTINSEAIFVIDDEDHFRRFASQLTGISNIYDSCVGYTIRLQRGELDPQITERVCPGFNTLTQLQKQAVFFDQEGETGVTYTPAQVVLVSPLLTDINVVAAVQILHQLSNKSEDTLNIMTNGKSAGGIMFSQNAWFEFLTVYEMNINHCFTHKNKLLMELCDEKAILAAIGKCVRALCHPSLVTLLPHAVRACHHFEEKVLVRHRDVNWKFVDPSSFFLQSVVKIADAAVKMTQIASKTLVDETCRTVQILMIHFSRVMMKHHNEQFENHPKFAHMSDLTYAAQMVIDMQEMTAEFSKVHDFTDRTFYPHHETFQNKRTDIHGYAQVIIKNDDLTTCENGEVRFKISKKEADIQKQEQNYEHIKWFGERYSTWVKINNAAFKAKRPMEDPTTIVPKDTTQSIYIDPYIQP